MRKLSAALFALVVLCVSGTAAADGARMLVSTTPATVPIASIVCGSAGTDSNNYSRFTATGQSLAYPIGAAETIIVTVYSDAGATATVDIETAPASGGPWYAVTTSHISNPSATGEQWSIPRTEFVRINVTAYTSGNIRACISGYRVDKKIY